MNPMVATFFLVLIIAGLVIYADYQDRRFKRRREMGLGQHPERASIDYERVDYSLRSWPRNDRGES